MTGAVVIGAFGQDGRLLGELLERQGVSCVRIGRGDLDLLDRAQVEDRIRRLQPREIYYLAAHHHSAEDPAGDDPELLRSSLEVHVTGLAHVLEAVRRHAPAARLFSAASSHVFGQSEQPLQDEQTPLEPTCIYGITKAAGVHLCRHYRRAHGLFAAVGILYNHESPYRGPTFVSQKIVRGARAIAAGEQRHLLLGDLSARIDWGYAPDYVDAMRRILALPQADDFVIATGAPHSVQEFASVAFAAVGLDWREHVREDPGRLAKQRRALAGDASRLRAATGWQPSVPFETMVRLLVAGRTP